MKSLKVGLLIALSAATLLIGCREEVVRTATGSPTETTAPRSCSKFGLCYKCGVGYNGKLSCGFRTSAFCPGTQTATVRATPMRIQYDDGTFDDFVATETVAADACQ